MPLRGRKTHSSRLFQFLAELIHSLFHHEGIEQCLELIVIFWHAQRAICGIEISVHE